MRTKAFLSCICLLSISFMSRSQETRSSDIKSIFTKGKYLLQIGGGAATYEGDLVEKSTFFGQPSFSVTGGAAFNFKKELQLDLDFSYMQLKADDKNNSRADLKARNLNFKSNVWDVNLTLQLNPVAVGKFTPYANIGIGLFHFNPTTTDRYGNKQYLHQLGTEGQGMLLFRDRTYLLTQPEIPFGIGTYYTLNSRMALKLDFTFRKTFTDYIDDVSTVYPDPALIDKKYPITKLLTFRGDEINPQAAYPTGQSRGNPGKNDFYYTGQIKLVYQLNKKLL